MNMKLKLSHMEKRDLLKAWAAISLAFAIAFSGGLGGIGLNARFAAAFLIAGLTVGVGFIAHELSHKVLAEKYGCWAEFRSFDNMLVMAILMSFFGFILAAPGGVFIKGRISKEKNGKISAAGIAANIVVAGLFFVLALVFPISAVKMIAVYGMMINSWLALFNLIPFMGFDGQKVLAWSRLNYAALIIAGFVMMFLSSVVSAG